ncbi:MAG TPA: NUDIX hydrolase [Rhodothermales bacterium]|nr:NUDIX hydrolase [Rhodothermales bacterium]
MNAWKKLSSRYLVERWWMNLRVDHVRLPNGVELPEYHVIEHPDWAAVICLTEDGRMVMVEQYRYAIDRMSLEFPAGTIDAGEDPLAAAKRELREETGYVSDDWTFLGKCAQDPSRQTNFAHFFVARNARRVGEPVLDHAEELALHFFRPEEVLEMADRGEIVHGVLLGGLFWAVRRGVLG